ncbi:hypothetical protein HY494_00545 [Candidatus Woesearchaeota archaeon]|nr:hypothetical protein [Candidatus Woesearchaeota archaeon]
MNLTDMKLTDKRELKRFDLNLGNYSVSGAICSYGDVIDFVDDLKQGVVLVDTCGHHEEVGKNVAAFLRTEIKNNWGITGDATNNLENLGRKLAALRNPTIPYWKSDEWFDMVSAEYAQFEGDNISLAMGGGLGETLILRNNGQLESILMYGGTIDLHYLENHEPAYVTILAKNEVMLLQSDGLLDNIEKNVYRSFPESKRKELDYGEFIRYMKGWLVSTIADKIQEPAGIIRERIIDQFSSYFLPKSLRDDDVTFAVIKKR